MMNKNSRQSAQDDVKSKFTAGPIKYATAFTYGSVEMLVHGVDNYRHMVRVKNQLTNAFGAQQGQQGRFLLDNGYTPVVRVQVDEIVAEYGVDDAVPDQEERTLMMKALVNGHIKRLEVIKVWYQTSFSAMLSVVPETMMAELKRDEAFLALEQEGDDPLALWAVIENIQITGFGGATDIERKMDATKLRNLVTQSADQDLTGWKQTFDAAHLYAESNGTTPVPEDEQAMEFLVKADEKRYGECIDSVRQHVARGVEQWPVTVAAAFKLLNDFGNIKNRASAASRNLDGNLFKGGRASGFAGYDQGKSTESALVSAPAVPAAPRYSTVLPAASRNFHGTCNWCGIGGHKQVDCRKKAAGVARVVNGSTSIRRAPAAMLAVEKEEDDQEEYVFLACCYAVSSDSESDIPALIDDDSSDSDSDIPALMDDDSSDSECEVCLDIAKPESGFLSTVVSSAYGRNYVSSDSDADIPALIPDDSSDSECDVCTDRIAKSDRPRVKSFKKRISKSAKKRLQRQKSESVVVPAKIDGNDTDSETMPELGAGSDSDSDFGLPELVEPDSSSDCDSEFGLPDLVEQDLSDDDNTASMSCVQGCNINESVVGGVVLVADEPMSYRSALLSNTHSDVIDKVKQNSTVYVWDTGCTQHMVCDASVSNKIKPIDKPITVVGIGGKTTVKYRAEIPLLGKVLFDSALPLNLVSSDRVEQLYTVHRIQGISYTVIVSSTCKLVFSRRADGLYVCKDMHDILQAALDADSVKALVSVADNKLTYTKAEVKRADEAEVLMRNLGVCGYDDAIRLVHSGGIINCPLTSQDILRHKSIYGKYAAGMRGNLTDKGPVGIVRVEHTAPVAKNLTIHTDVVFFEQVPLLVSVCKPINLLIATDICGSKSARSLRDSLTSQVKMLQDRGFVITHIHSDAESNFCTTRVAGVPMSQAGAGSHEPVVERAVRVIKERCRSVLASLPFTVCKSIIKYLVYFIVGRINCIPRDSGIGVSGRQALRGVKLDYRIDIKLSFGDYVEVHAQSKSIAHPRAVSCIALHPTDNGRGSWKFLSLTSNEVITSDNYVCLPTTQVIIDKMNSLVAADAKTHQFIQDKIEYFNTSDSVTVSDVPSAPLITLAPTVDANETGNADIPSGGDPVDDVPLGGDGSESVLVSADPASTQEVNMSENSCFPGIPQTEVHAFLQLSLRKGLAKHATVAEEAVAAELRQICEKNVWKPMFRSQLTPEQKKSTIRCFIFLKEKYDKDGALDRLKGRLVAGGHMQDKNAIFAKSSPTVGTESQFMIYAVAAGEKRKFQSVDIEGAFLEVELTGEPIFVLIDAVMSKILILMYPEYAQYANDKGEIVVQLLKALYGCVQSAYLFYAKLKGTLEDLGFVENPTDKCVYNKIICGTQCTVSFHVDDLFITHVSDLEIDKVVEAIAARFSAVKRQKGSEFMHLGINVVGEDNGNIHLTMVQYTKSCVEAWGVKRGAKTPATADLFEIDEQSPRLKSVSSDNFHTGVAKLLYLTKRTRPDILTVISFLAGRVHVSTEQDWKKLTRVFEYLSVTANFGVKFIGGLAIDLEGWGDASFMCHEDTKGRSGGVVKLCGGVVATNSSKQKIVCKSSTEAELVSLCSIATWVLICREFLLAQGHVLPVSRIYQDNRSVLAMVKNGKPTSHNSKHIKMRYFFVVEHINNGEVTLEWCHTDVMVADAMTKPLVGEIFVTMRDFLVAPVNV